MTLYVVRHGESAENVGESRNDDSALTERGREQARRTAEWLTEGTSSDDVPTDVWPLPSDHFRPSVVYASPALRAIETARPIAAACGAPLVIQPDLCESGLLYDAPGLSAAEVREIVPEAILPEDFPEERGWAADFDGESKADLVARCERIASTMTALHPVGSGTIAMVSHAHFSGFFIGRLFGIPAESLSQNRIRLANCGVSRIDFATKYKVMRYANASFHLGDVGPLEQQRGVGPA
jgi:probable phosphoglycerate mutase